MNQNFFQDRWEVVKDLQQYSGLTNIGKPANDWHRRRLNRWKQHLQIDWRVEALWSLSFFQKYCDIFTKIICEVNEVHLFARDNRGNMAPQPSDELHVPIAKEEMQSCLQHL